MFEGCLPADALIRAEPFFWLQRLYLGQLFPALFPTAREDFSSSGGPRAGKKAVLVATFSFGRLVCSFHEAWIIVKFVCNIQRFVLPEQKTLFIFPPVSLRKKIFLPVDKRFFCCRMPSLMSCVRSFFWANVYFGLFFAVDNMFISYLLTLSYFLS
jgi:hypothetical protein